MKENERIREEKKEIEIEMVKFRTQIERENGTDGRRNK